MRRGINYQPHLHVTAVDIAPRAVHLGYIQLSRLYVPAVIFVGNSLGTELRQSWYTPAPILGGWNAKIAARRSDAAAPTVNGPAPPPVVSALAAPPPGRPIQLSLF